MLPSARLNHNDELIHTVGRSATELFNSCFHIHDELHPGLEDQIGNQTFQKFNVADYASLPPVSTVPSVSNRMPFAFFAYLTVYHRLGDLEEFSEVRRRNRYAPRQAFHLDIVRFLSVTFGKAKSSPRFRIRSHPQPTPSASCAYKRANIAENVFSRLRLFL
jgi:hypothetical protein